MTDDPIDVKLERIHAVIHTERGPIPMKEFADFFRSFRTAYAASVDALVTNGNLGAMASSESVDWVVSLTNQHLNNLSDEDIASFDSRTLELVEPVIVTIRRENPIELIIGGIVLALAAATILSGGKFKITREGVEVELPPIGLGIQKLKEALRF